MLVGILETHFFLYLFDDFVRVSVQNNRAGYFTDFADFSCGIPFGVVVHRQINRRVRLDEELLIFFHVRKNLYDDIVINVLLVVLVGQNVSNPLYQFCHMQKGMPVFGCLV